MSAYTSPWRCFACDFHEITGQEPVFAQGFDFSFSTMSPAIHDVETVKKMSGMTHGWCFLSRFCAWQQPVRDEVMRRAGLVPRSMFGDLEADCATLVQAVSAAGFRPQLRYADYSWSDRRSPADMADYMLRHYWDGAEGREAAAKAFEEAARSLCDSQGLVSDVVDTKVAWIYWDARLSPGAQVGKA